MPQLVVQWTLLSVAVVRASASPTYVVSYRNPSPVKRQLSQSATALSSPSPDKNSPNHTVLLVPLIVLAVAVVAFGVYLRVFKKKPAPVSSSTTQARAVTGVSGDLRPVRPRRNRRTASQRSTRSLPAYNEEPGDEELVLVGRQRSMEPPLEEMEEDSPRNTIESARLYHTDHPRDSSIDVSRPLMQPDYSHTPHTLTHSRQPSHSSQNEGHDQGLEDDTTHPIPPGVTPPAYFEVVGDNSGAPLARIPSHSPSSSISLPTRTQTNDTATSGHSSRGSIFSLGNLLGGHRSRGSSESNTLSTPMADASRSSPSLALSRSRSPSGAGFSRFSSTVNQNAASSASLVISPPLAHTLTRTEFSFPKSGPTPQQVSFLTSRESLGRFGLPYGIDAEAAAQEARRQRLLDEEDAPPAFESPIVEITAGGVATGGPSGETSRRRSGSASSHSEAEPSRLIPPPTTTSADTSGASASSDNPAAPTTILLPAQTPLIHVIAASSSSTTPTSSTPISVAIPQTRPASPSVSTLRSTNSQPLSPIPASPIPSVIHGSAA